MLVPSPHRPPIPDKIIAREPKPGNVLRPLAASRVTGVTLRLAISMRRKAGPSPMYKFVPSPQIAVGRMKLACSPTPSFKPVGVSTPASIETAYATGLGVIND